MNSFKSIYDIKTFYSKKSGVHKASYKGMRYMIKAKNLGSDDVLLSAFIWPEPFCFEKTDSDLIEENEFSFTDEGLKEAYDWICARYEEEPDKWSHIKQLKQPSLKN